MLDMDRMLIFNLVFLAVMFEPRGTPNGLTGNYAGSLG